MRSLAAASAARYSSIACSLSMACLALRSNLAKCVGDISLFICPPYAVGCGCGESPSRLRLPKPWNGAPASTVPGETLSAGACRDECGPRETPRDLRYERCSGASGGSQRSCWYPWLVVFCFMFPCRSCSARFAGWPGLGSCSFRVGSMPGPFVLRLAGGTGGIWLIFFCSFCCLLQLINNIGVSEALSILCV